MPEGGQNQIFFGDNLEVLRTLKDGSVQLIYIDPPFNTGLARKKVTLKTIADRLGDRVGFGGRRYRSFAVGTRSYDDSFDNFGDFLRPRLQEAHRILDEHGSIFVHLDPRESHYCKIWLDTIFGRKSFINEIIWAYDYGGRGRDKWPSKHDVILWYAKNPKKYTFNYENIDRIPYMAPGLVSPEKAKNGKIPTDTWWNTIVATNSREKTGYPTQKPLAILERIVRVHSNEGDLVLDFFAGSGTTGEAAAKLGRKFLLIDSNPEAIKIMSSRLDSYGPKVATLKAATKGLKSALPSSAGPGKSSDQNKSLVHIIAASVWKYEHLSKLAGPKHDAASIREFFVGSQLGIYEAERFTELLNPSLDDLQRALLDYAETRTAHGDILIFYFTGHGCVIGGNDFGFCPVDAKVCNTPSGGGILPLSVLSFSQLVRTLSLVDVHPVMIIDACFSAAIGTTDSLRITESMHDNLQRHAASSYGILCSSYEQSASIDQPDGGVFTKALRAVAEKGMGGKLKRQHFLTLMDLAEPVQESLSRDGMPLSRLHVGPGLPQIPLVRNVAFEARTERFGKELYEAITYMHKVHPAEVNVSDFAAHVSNTAYGNHNKLSYLPWGLSKKGSNARKRRLTERGLRFAKGLLSIPEVIERVGDSDEWQAQSGTRQVAYKDFK